MSNALIKAAMRQNAKLQELQNQNKATVGELEQLSQWSEAPKDADGLLGSVYGGFATASLSGLKGAAGLWNEITDPNSVTALQANLSRQEQDLINRKEKQNQIQRDLMEAQQMLSDAQTDAQREAIINVIKQKEADLGSIQFNDDENNLWNTKNLGVSHEALLQANQTKQEKQDWWNSNIDYWRDDFNTTARNAQIQHEYSKLGRAPNLFERVERHFANTDAESLAQGIGNLGAFAVPYVGKAILAGDTARVYDEATIHARQDRDSLTNTGEEQLKALVGAGAYGYLNKASIDKLKGSFNALGRGKAAEIPLAATIEGLAEGAQEAIENVAAGRKVDEEAVAAGAVQGFLSAGSISAAGNVANSAKEGFKELKEGFKFDISNKSEEDINQFVRDSVQTPYDEQGNITSKYNPAEAINRLRNNREKAEVVLKYAENHVSKAQEVLDLVSNAETVIADTSSTPEQIKEAQELLQEVSVEKATQELTSLQEKLTQAQDAFSKTFTPEEITDTETKQPATAANILRSPLNYSREEVEKAIEETDNEEEKILLRTLSELKLKQNLLKNPSEVYKNIKEGNEEYIGLQEYYRSLETAMQTQDSGLYESKMEKLAAFNESHTSKSAAVAEALAESQATGQQVQVVRDVSGDWVINDGTHLKGKALRENGGLNINAAASRSVDLVNQIHEEAQLINEAFEAYDKMAGFFNSDITKANRQARSEAIQARINTIEASAVRRPETKQQERQEQNQQEKQKSVQPNKSAREVNNIREHAEVEDILETENTTSNSTPVNIKEDDVVNALKAANPGVDSKREGFFRRVIQYSQGATKLITSFGINSKGEQKQLHDAFKAANLNSVNNQFTSDDIVFVHPSRNIPPQEKISKENSYEKMFYDTVDKAIAAKATIQFGLGNNSISKTDYKKSRKGVKNWAMIESIEKTLAENKYHYLGEDANGNSTSRWVHESNLNNPKHNPKASKTAQEAPKKENKEKPKQSTTQEQKQAQKPSQKPEQKQEQKQTEKPKQKTQQRAEPETIEQTQEDTQEQVQEEQVQEEVETEEEQGIPDPVMKLGNKFTRSKNLLSEHKNIRNKFNAAQVTELREDVEYTEAQLNQLQSVKEYMDEFVEIFKHSFRGEVEDIPGLIREVGDDLIIDENFANASALVVYDQILRQGNKEVPDREEILKQVVSKFGGNFVSQKTYAAFATAGIPRNFFMQDMGKAVINMLGIKPTKEAKLKDQGRLETAIGIATYNAAVEMDLFNETEMSFKQYYENILPSLNNDGINKLANDIAGEFNTPEPWNDKNYEKYKGTRAKQLAYIEEKLAAKTGTLVNKKVFFAYPNVIDAVKSEKGFEGRDENLAGKLVREEKENTGDNVIDVIFNNEKPPKLPSFEPPKELKQIRIKGTKEGIPAKVRKILTKVAQRPWRIDTSRVDMLRRVQKEQPEVLNAILGLKSREELENLHNDIKAEQLQNDAYYRRRLDTMLAFAEEAKDRDVYLTPTVWSNIRAGYENQFFNPQAHLLDRILITPKSFETKVDTTQELFVDGKLTTHGHFLMGVAEGIDKALGDFLPKEKKGSYNIFAPDKVLSADYLPLFVDYINSEAVQKAVKAVDKLINTNNKLSTEETQDITDILESWDTKEVGFGTLLELANYFKAKETKGTFTTYQGRQSDGVTNGAVTTQMLLNLLKNTAMGGVFLDGSGLVSIQQALKQGTGDLYMSLGRSIGNAFESFAFNSFRDTVTDVLRTFVKDMQSRGIGKAILTPFNYGAGLKKVNAVLGSEAVKAYQKAFYGLKHLKGQARTRALLAINAQNRAMLETYNRIFKINNFDLDNDEHVHAFVAINNSQALSREDLIIASGNYELAKEEDKKAITNELRNIIKERIKSNNNQFNSEGRDLTKEEYKSKAWGKYQQMVMSNDVFRNYSEESVTITELDAHLPYAMEDIIFRLTSVFAGTASKLAVLDDYAEYIKVRNAVTKNLNNTFQMYDSLETSYIQKVYKVNDALSLTFEQKKELDEALKPYRPIISNPFGAQQILDEGLYISDEGTVETGEKVEVNLRSQSGRGISISSPVKVKKDIEPGVRIMALLIQSMDAYVSFSTMDDHDVVNLHDADIAALDDAVNMTKSQNKHWFQNQINYDFFGEVVAAENRVLYGFEELFDLGVGIDPDALKNVMATLLYGDPHVDGSEPDIGAVYLGGSTLLKLNQLREVTGVAQYGLEEGTYVPTEEDIERINNKIKYIQTTENAFNVSENPVFVSNINISKPKRSSSQLTPEDILTPLESKKLREVFNNLSTTSFLEIFNKEVIDKDQANRFIRRIFLSNELPQSSSKVTTSQLRPDAEYKTVDSKDARLQGRKANFSRIDNTIYVDRNLRGMDFMHLMQTYLQAQLHETVLGIKLGLKVSKETEEAYKQLEYFAQNYDSLIEAADNISKEEKDFLKKYDPKSDIELLMSFLFTSEHFNKTLNKVNYKKANEKSNLLQSIIEAFKNLLGNYFKIFGTNGIGDVLFNSSKRVLIAAVNEEVVSEREAIRKQALESTSRIPVRVSEIRSFQNTDKQFLNYVRTKLENNTISMKELSKVLKESIDETYSAWVKPVADWVHKQIGDGKVVFVGNKEHISALGENASVEFVNGDAFYEPDSNTIYVMLPEVVGSSVHGFTGMLHEMVHAVTVNKLPKGKKDKLNNMYKKAHKEIKEDLYAFKDLNEFIAEVLTDGRTQKLILNNSNLGEEFLNDIFKTLGIESLKTLQTIAPTLSDEVTKDFSEPVEEVQPSTEEVADTRLEALGKLVGTKFSVRDFTLKKEEKDSLLEKLKEQGVTTKGNQYKDLGAAMTEALKVWERQGKNNNELFSLIVPYFDPIITANAQILKSPLRTSTVNTPQEIFSNLYADETHLVGLVNNVVNPLMDKVEPRLLRGAPGISWYNHLVNGSAFFVSEAYQAGFSLTPAEGFVMETMESALYGILDEVVDTPAYRKLYESYRQAKLRVSPEDFHEGDWNKATAIERRIAQDKWNFLFNTDFSSDKKSDYLTRFVALGLTNQEVGKVLGFVAKTPEAKSLTEKGTNLLNKVIDWWFDRHTSVDDDTTITNKLRTISEELASIYMRNRDQIEEKKSITDLVSPKLQLFEDKALGLAANMINVLKAVPNVKASNVDRIREDFKNRRLSKVAEQVANAVNTINPHKPIGEFRSIFNEIVGYDSLKTNEGAKDLFGIMKSLEQARAEQMESVKRRLNDVFGKISKETSRAFTQTVLKTDLQALTSEFSNKEIYELIQDRTKLKEAIKDFEGRIANLPNGNEFIVRGKNLAHYMVYKRAIAPMLAKNAYAIVAGVGNSRGRYQTNKQTINNLDKLISLYALNEVLPSVRKTVNEADNFDGFNALITMHKQAAKLSERDFQKNKFSYTKGYVPTILNPYKDFVTVTEDQIREYEVMGYKLLHELPVDNNDAFRKTRYGMLHTNTNQDSYVSGILSLVNNKRSGTTVTTASAKDFKKYNESITRDGEASFRTPYKSFEGDYEQVFLIPTYDSNGEVLSYTYEMEAAQMDAYLDRNNDMFEVMAALYGKATVTSVLPNQNNDVIDYLIKVRKEAPSHELDTFVEISATASTKRARDLWHLLPYETKQYLQDEYGKASLQVKNSLIDLVWGYQKVTPFAIKAEDYAQMNAMQQLTHTMLETMLGKKIKNSVGGLYAGWLELVKLFKSFVVVRGFTVLFGNIMSNMSVLMINGGNPVRAVKDISVALKYSLEYKKDREEYLNLAWKVREGIETKKNRASMAEIRDKIERNPLKDFINSNMMPSIVSDVNLVNSEFKYKPAWMEKLDELESKAPSFVRDAVKNLFVSEDTSLHKFMLNVTQQSDFVFRYAMYQQEIRRGTDKKEALRIAKDTYIDYDVPTSRYMQWANDTGFWMFSKFFMRFQRVLARLIERHPLAVTAEHLVTTKLLGLPSVWSLGIISRMYEGQNPMRMPLDDVMGMHGHAAPMQILDAVL